MPKFIWFIIDGKFQGMENALEIFNIFSHNLRNDLKKKIFLSNDFNSCLHVFKYILNLQTFPYHSYLPQLLIDVEKLRNDANHKKKTFSMK